MDNPSGMDAVGSDAPAAHVDGDESVPELSAQRNELLCFVQQKLPVMAFDHLVKVCADYYRKDEIFAARSAVDAHIAKRLPRRQGGDVARHTLEDIMKTCLDPSAKLPCFYATDLTRLPPVSVDYCDVSGLLKEIQALRAEVREINELKTEVYFLREEVKQLKSQSLCTATAVAS